VVNREYSCWVTHSVEITKGTAILFTIISMIIAVMTVYLAAAKVNSNSFYFRHYLLVHDCQLNFKKTAQNPLEYNTDPRSVAIGDYNNNQKLDFAMGNYDTDNLQSYLQTC
jgi:hypothetical protein